MTTPDTLPECQAYCEKLKQTIWELTGACDDLLILATGFQLSPGEYAYIGRARTVSRRALALAGQPPRREGP